MFKKLFWLIVFIFAGWWIYLQLKKEVIKKKIMLNPVLNDLVQNDALTNKISYSEQLNKTASFIAKNS